jgi:hypothetical protein
MSMTRRNSFSRALGAVLLAGALVGCEFIQPIESDPNAVPEASVDQLFVAIQVNTMLFEEGQTSRLAAMWTQQMAGTDRQFQILDQYVISEEEGDPYFNFYTGGGLVDLRRAIGLAEDANRRVYAGILKVYEAYSLGMLASVFGDVAYSEAVNADIATPKLDGQAAVYAAAQALLDEAIADLQSGTGASPGAVDFAFGGNAARWTAVARTIKARFFLHWAEGTAANYANAITQANQGITTAAGDWRATHSNAATENNLWFQFNRDRSGYISAGEYLVDALQSRGDPRLALYYTTGSGAFAGQYVGSPPGTRNRAGGGADPGQDASQLNPDGAGAPDYRQPFVTCAENYFILAEAQFRTGLADATVRSSLDNALACEATRKAVSTAAAQAANDALTGAALFDEILLQKYMSLFLNIEVWNDYKRTCRPAITRHLNQQLPGRLLYPDEESTTNPNIPAATAQPVRNANDPAGCP